MSKMVERQYRRGEEAIDRYRKGVLWEFNGQTHCAVPPSMLPG